MDEYKTELSTFLKKQLGTIERRQRYLTTKLSDLHNHITCLYEMSHDTSNIPPAQGHTKLIQQGCLVLAKMIDADLRAAGIPYFLAAGNLLGAVRNGQFIPWDDDVDFDLMRPDFDRAVELLTEKYNRGPFKTAWAQSGGIFKVLFANKVCIDLFPMDTYTKRTQTPEDIKQFKADYKVAMDEARKWEHGESEYNGYVDITNNMIMHGESPAPDGDIFEAIDWQLYTERMTKHYHNYLWRHEWILPYREIEFCGHMFMAPNNPEAWLTTRYGDWERFRPEFSKHSKVKLTCHDINLLHAFINGDVK